PADLRTGFAPNPARGIFGARFQVVVCVSPQNLSLGEERLSFLEQRAIVGTGAFYKRQTRAGRFLLESITEDGLQSLPSLRIHAHQSACDNSRCSHTLASAHSRCTVATEISMAEL